MNPVASFTYVKDNLRVDFTDTSTSEGAIIATRLWNFGDGAISTSANPIHVYSLAGTYDVQLTVLDSDSESDVVIQQVSVVAAPTEGPVRRTIRSLWRWGTWQLTRPLHREANTFCTYTVRDPSVRHNLVEQWPVKRVDDVLKFTIDWSFYAATDRIVDSSWENDAGFLMVDEGFSYTSTYISATDGVDRTTYAMKNNVILQSGLSLSQTVRFIVNDRVCN